MDFGVRIGLGFNEIAALHAWEYLAVIRALPVTGGIEMRGSHGLFVVPVAAVLIACPGCVSVGPVRDMDPRADEALKGMGSALAGAAAFSFEARDTMDEIIEGGQMAEFAGSYRIDVRRPNGVFATSSGDGIERAFWYDGGTVTLLDKRRHLYASVEAPGTIDEMLEFLIAEHGLTVPLADILFSDPYKALVENVKSGRFLGLYELDGSPCRHLAFRQERIDWQIWIEAGPRPLPRKVVISYLDSPGEPQYEATFSRWNLSPDFPDALFSFAPPEGATRVEMDVLLKPRDRGDRS